MTWATLRACIVATCGVLALLACGRERAAEPVAFEVVEPDGPEAAPAVPARDRFVGRYEHEAEVGGVAFVTGVVFDGQRLVRLRDGVETGADVCTVVSEAEATLMLRCTDEAGSVMRRAWALEADGSATDVVAGVTYRRVGDVARAADGSGAGAAGAAEE